MTGGKFANGAISAAFVRAFNDEMHYQNDPNEIQVKTDEQSIEVDVPGAKVKVGKILKIQLSVKMTDECTGGCNNEFADVDIMLRAEAGPVSIKYKVAKGGNLEFDSVDLHLVAF